MAQMRGVVRRVAANAVRLLRARSAAALYREGGVWLHVKLDSELGDLASPPLALGRAGGLSLLDLLRTLDTAAQDRDLSGVLLQLRGGLEGWNQALALRRSLLALRRAELPVVAWAESLNARGYLAVSAANRVYLPETGTLDLVGLRTEHFYFRDLLERLEVAPEVVHVGKFKSAGEMMTRSSMSDEQRQQLEAWQGDVFAELVGGIAEGRQLAPSRVEELIDCGPYPASAARQAGLVDDLLYWDQIEAELEMLSPIPGLERPGRRKARKLAADRYFSLRAADVGWKPLTWDLPRLAYVVARGNIGRGTGRFGISSQGLSELLERLLLDSGVMGVLLRIESGGGDALASDLLHRAVKRVAREKPVVVSMGEVAASGGYYIAAAADAIFAEATTVTGSIGVVGGKINLARLYRRLGIAKEAVERGARAGLHSEARGFSPDERVAVEQAMASIYGIFLQRVARGRELSLEEVEEVAQGRIWSGRGALSAGLVDALGGPMEALCELRRRAGLDRTERFELELHPRRPRLPELRRLLA
jgi:protease-4